MSKDFSFDLAEVEAAVISDKRDSLIELLLNKTPVIRHRSNADECCRFTVVAIDLGDRDVVAAFQSFNDAFDDVAFIFEAVYAEQMQLSCHHTNNHITNIKNQIAEIKQKPASRKRKPADAGFLFNQLSKISQ